jgi:CRISPR system Cascade subunit CasD
VNALAFELAVPLSSWAVGGNAIAPTMAVPTWSAVVGMIGAALGIPRDDDRLPIIAADYGLAVQAMDAGEREYDYHTIQSPMASKVRPLRPRTRAQELDLDSVDDLNTTITRREYIHGARYRVFIVQLTDAPLFPVDQIVTALRNPEYPLYAGRRSCVVGRVNAQPVPMDALVDATHWDQRIPLEKPHAMVAERHDLLTGCRTFSIRHECIA